MRARLAILASLSVVVSMLLPMAPASATVWWLQYSDRSTGRCLAMPYDADTVHAQQASCLTPVGPGADMQLFQLVSLGNGNSWIVPQRGGRCLVDAKTSPDQGAPVQQLTCDIGNISQQWTISVVSEQPNGSANLRFRSARTGKCMTGGSSPLMYTCDSSNTAQVWHQHLKEGCARCRPSSPAVVERLG